MYEYHSMECALTSPLRTEFGDVLDAMLCVCVHCFVVRGCSVGRRYIDVCCRCVACNICDPVTIGVGCECNCCNRAGVGVVGVSWLRVCVISNSDGTILRCLSVCLLHE